MTAAGAPRGCRAILLSAVLVGALVGVLPAGALLGAQQSDSTRAARDSAQTFDPVIVTAARRDERRSDAVISTAVVTRRDIVNTAASDVAAVLTQQLGLQLASGSPAGSQILIQGLGDQQVLVLLDGQPLAGRIGGALDLSRIPTSIVERIEVVKGPQSLFYGTDAMGGVINIITRTPPEGAGAIGLGATVIAGSHDRLDVSGRVSGRLSANMPYGLDVGRNYVALAPGVAGESGAYAERWNVTPRFQWRATPTLDIDVGGLGIIEQQRYRGGQLFTFSDNTQSAAHAAATWRRGTNRFTSSLAFSSFDHLSRASTSGRPASDSGAHDLQRTATANLGFSGVAGRSLFVDAGTELRRETIRADRVPGARGNNSVALFSQATWASEWLSIVPGARVSWSDQWGTNFTPRVAIMSRPLGGDHPLTLRASLSGGFRAPDFKELYLRFVNASAGYAVDGNATLRPEHSTNASAEAEWVGGGLNLRASVFYNRIRDLIETVGPDAQGLYTYDNVGLATTSGAELEAGRRWRAAEVRVGYSYLHTHDVSLGGPILGRATHSGRGTLDTPVWRRLRLAVTGVYTGDAPSARDSLGRVSMVREALMQVNLRAAHPIPAWAGVGEIFAGVDDVFDEQRGYEWPGFTGRQLSVGLSWPGR